MPRHYSKFSIIQTVTCHYYLNTARISELVSISEQAIKSDRTREKVSLKLPFNEGLMELEKNRNKAEIKERKKTTGHLQKHTAGVW